MRLDQYIAEKLNLSRNRAQFLIDEKLVKVNSNTFTKASYLLKESDLVEITEDKKIEYVARSAIKLEEFLNELEIDGKSLNIKGVVCLDIGASTGGFTQILLSRGASRVYALDVGTLQLHEKIRNDSRVISIENTDIREFKSEVEKFDLIVTDLSFISLHKILGKILELSADETKIILLFKPQFEVGRINMKKTGVPKDQKVIIAALDRFKSACKDLGFIISKISESKLPGEAGNVEYFIFMKKNV